VRATASLPLEKERRTPRVDLPSADVASDGFECLAVVLKDSTIG